MTHEKGSQFIVRALRNEAELAQCLQLEHSYATDHVWQVDMRDVTANVSVRFRTARLPREMQVAYPRDAEQLRESWKHNECFLAAVANDAILGYVTMRTGPTRNQGWIPDLVVHRPLHRRKIGSALLEQAERWALLHGINQITFELQTKNYPGICFVRAHGFQFCGFNDHYYHNQDIAVFFSKTL